MQQPGAFLLWLGVCALVSWRTAFQMPDGFGNAIFGCQLLAGAISSLMMAIYLPPAIGQMRTMPRRTAQKFVAIALVVFLAGNIGGYALDRGLGLPERYADDAVPPVAAWISQEPKLGKCLATVWAPASTCTLDFVVTPDERLPAGSFSVFVVLSRCGNPALEGCTREGLTNGTITLPERRAASFAYAEYTRIRITTILVGRGPPPPVERGP
jgi:hypothetical protein